MDMAHGFYPNNNGAQKRFAQALNSKLYPQALKQFEDAFSDSYKKSIDGYALRSLLMFNSGIELTGMQQLFALKHPKKINVTLKKMWSDSAPIQHPIWKLLNTKVTSKWSSVFPFIGNYNGFLFPHYKPKNIGQLKKLERTNYNSLIMTDWHHFQLGLWNGIFGKANKGLAYLNKIPSNSKTVNKNQVHLARGRLQFQLKRHQQAIRSYQRVSKKSDYWAISLEEQAYTYTVMGKPGLGLAKLKSLFTPVLAPFAGAEPYMLTAFNQEQNCDYISSFKTVTNYKKTFIPRARSLKKLAGHQMTQQLRTLLSNKQSFSWENLGSNIELLPTNIYTDKFLIKYFNTKNALVNDLVKMRQFGVNGEIIERSRNTADKKIPYYDRQITERIAYLASKDLKTISNITKKMHLIEAEIIQQLHIKKDIKKASGFSRPNSREVLVFPDDGEVWLDEIDKYNASIGFCNKKRGKTL